MKKIITRAKNTIINFWKPFAILVSILVYLLIEGLGFDFIARWFIFSIVILGSLRLFVNSFKDLFKGKFALDYIALLAITVSLITGQFLVGAIIVLMLTGGQTLEDYGVAQARRSLTALANRIPNEVLLWKDGRASDKTKIELVEVGQEILIRRGEVIPLDGILVSESGMADESSLTGEPYEIDKLSGDQIRSGTVNIGDLMIVKVTKAEKDSTYRKIVDMVKAASEEKAPLVRLADKYSTVFTLVTLAICAFAWWYSKDFSMVLSVLVIATPCPLILATPIALMGGMNAAAKKRIIIKSLSSLEVLSRVSTLIFDKTGTITLGKPIVTNVELMNDKYTESEVMEISEAIERNSLHPLAKAIVEKARSLNVIKKIAIEVSEKIGKGIEGTVEGKRYLLAKSEHQEGMAIDLSLEGKIVARLNFEDEIKRDSKKIFEKLVKHGMGVYIFTGDKKAAADKVVKSLGMDVHIKAECTPEDKKDGIKKLQAEGNVTAMVGDGINDAPALAVADVGMVFSNEEQTAASEAADIVFLGGDMGSVLQSHLIAERSVRIAMQSILWGIGLSILGMVFAAFGYLPPIAGAFLQEAIDVAVIINALRASR
jgi:heavy metal translocating P-type ATPase